MVGVVKEVVRKQTYNHNCLNIDNLARINWTPHEFNFVDEFLKKLVQHNKLIRYQVNIS